MTIQSFSAEHQNKGYSEKKMLFEESDFFTATPTGHSVPIYSFETQGSLRAAFESQADNALKYLNTTWEEDFMLYN